MARNSLPAPTPGMTTIQVVMYNEARNSMLLFFTAYIREMNAKNYLYLLE